MFIKTACVVAFIVLGRIALAQTIPLIATHFPVAWSVSLSVVCRLSHLCIVLKPLDGFRCHLTGTVTESIDTLCQMERGDFGVKVVSIKKIHL